MTLGRARRITVIATRALCHGAFALLLIALFVPQAGCGRSFICAGSDETCSSYAEAACAALTGCSWTGLCSAPSCDGADQALNQAECTSTAGCAWDAGSVPSPCSAEASAVQCAQPTQAECMTVSSCSWTVECRPNQAVQCSDAESQAACDKIGRCRWVETGPDSLG